jgi:maleylacetoacetate isomerase
MQISLYHYWRSSCSWRVRWALNTKNVPYDLHPVNLLTQEQRDPKFLAVNPSGFVPAMKVDDQILGESLAILEWIEETWPSPALLPTTPNDRALVRQMSLVIVSGTQPLQNLSVMRAYSDDQAEQKAWAQRWIDEGLAKFDKLAEKHSGSFSFKDQLTFADLCLIPQLYNARRFDIDTSKYPLLERIDKRCLAIKECFDAAPEQHQPNSSLARN